MRRRAALTTGCVFAFAALCPPATALTARELLDRAKTLDDTTRHWNDRTQHMILTIGDTGGTERKRDLLVCTKRFPADEEKTISFFSAPPEVRGTGFLQWSHRGREGEQWLYLPEFKRTRQIAARLRDEPFVGTDFTYRDLEIVSEFLRWSEADAPTKLLGDETIDGRICDTIELRPHQDGIPYQRLVLSLDRELLTPRKLQFFDLDGTLLKTLTLSDIRDIGTIPTAQHLEMRNHKRGSRTLVDLREVTYDSHLDDELFTQRQLERGAP